MPSLEEIHVDLTQPVSSVLKQGTSKAHEDAQHSEGASWLTKGQLDRDEYIRFLMMLFHVYDTLERALTKNASHPVLEPTSNATLLARAPSLGSDIAYLLSAPEDTWQSHPSHTAFLLALPQPVKAYTERIELLSDTEPARLLSHAYVRYLGDLSGGQVVKRRVAKSYGIDLEGDDQSGHAGVRFYEFASLEGTQRIASQGDMKKVKEWFRNGMNAGAGADEQLKLSILEEAITAFNLNLALFTTLREPSNRPPSPISSDSAASSSDLSSPIAESKELPIEIVLPKPEEPERLVSLGSVISVLLTICLAHFLLVTSGLTGSGWLDRLNGLGLLLDS